MAASGPPVSWQMLPVPAYLGRLGSRGSCEDGCLAKEGHCKEKRWREGRLHALSLPVGTLRLPTLSDAPAASWCQRLSSPHGPGCLQNNG